MTRLLALLTMIGLATAAQAQLTPQQERMKTCNASASERELKGDERQDFMSRCLKGESVANSQQDRMRMCNVQAGERQLKGDARQDFMSECLRNHDKLTAQQEKMKTCNREAGDKNLDGDKRRAFMSECLRADSGTDAGKRTSAAGGTKR